MNDDPQIKAWVDGQKKNLDALKTSVAFCGLVSPDYLKDPLCMLQIGAAICFGKPIFLIVFDDAELPMKLRGVADRVIRCKRNEIEKATEELAQFVAALGK